MRISVSSPSSTTAILSDANMTKTRKVTYPYAKPCSYEECVSDFDLVWAKMGGYPWWPALFFWSKEPLLQAGLRSCFSDAFEGIVVPKNKPSRIYCLVLFLDEFKFSVLTYALGKTILPFLSHYDYVTKKILKNPNSKKSNAKRLSMMKAIKKANFLLHPHGLVLESDYNFIKSKQVTVLNASDHPQSSNCIEQNSNAQDANKSTPLKFASMVLDDKLVKDEKDATPETKKTFSCLSIRAKDSESAPQNSLIACEQTGDRASDLSDENTSAILFDSPLSRMWILKDNIISAVYRDNIVWNTNIFEDVHESNCDPDAVEDTCSNKKNGNRNARKNKHRASRTFGIRRDLSSNDLDPHAMIQCMSYNCKHKSAELEAPFKIVAHPEVVFICDLHAHLATCEIIGFLGGRWDPEQKTLYIQAAFPCRALPNEDDNGATDVEMDPESEIILRDIIQDAQLEVVGWYHSHPTFAPDPSIKDIENQTNYQRLFRRQCLHTSNVNPTESNIQDADNTNASVAPKLENENDGEKALERLDTVEPFVGLIVGTYDTKRTTPISLFRFFHTRKEEYKSPSNSTARIVCLPYELPCNTPVHKSVVTEESQYTDRKLTKNQAAHTKARASKCIQHPCHPDAQGTCKVTSHTGNHSSTAEEFVKVNASSEQVEQHYSKSIYENGSSNSVLYSAIQCKSDVINLKTDEGEQLRDLKRLHEAAREPVQHASARGIVSETPFSPKKNNNVEQEIKGQNSGDSRIGNRAIKISSDDSFDFPMLGVEDDDKFAKYDDQKSEQDHLLHHRGTCPTIVDSDDQNVVWYDSAFDPKNKYFYGMNSSHNLARAIGTPGLRHATRKRNRKANQPIKRICQVDRGNDFDINTVDAGLMVFDETILKCEISEKREPTVSLKNADCYQHLLIENGECAKSEEVTVLNSASTDLLEAAKQLHQLATNNVERVDDDTVKNDGPISNETLERHQSEAERMEDTDSSSCSRIQQIELDPSKLEQYHLLSLQTRYGRNVLNCVEQIVALIDYYGTFPHRTNFSHIWKSKISKLEKLEASLMANVQKLTLPVQLRTAFVKDVIAYIKSSWETDTRL